MARQDIAIIGGGAKAAALAAKASCLRQTGRADIHVTIFERAVVGAHWDGNHGYSDGHQLLCTPGERDLGFPYDAATVGQDVTTLMASEFSWMAHTVRQGADPAYADWVNRGRRRPTHAQFAGYLRDAVSRSGATLIQGADVIALTPGWTVRARINGVEHDHSGFDGVVVTSPGPQSRRIPTVADDRIFDGETFWRDLGNVKVKADATEDPIVIVGFGGTAAAVAAWFVRNGYGDREIVLIAEQASLHPRIDNLFENRLFDDEVAWEALSNDHKLGFSDRLSRGVVWASVAEELTQAQALTFRYGRVESITQDVAPANGEPADLYVNFRAIGATSDTELAAGLVVNASGFDTWWFADLLPAVMGSAIRNNTKKAVEDVQRDLSLAAPAPTRLHVPIVSQIQGPGFGSLMVLGAMSDRILRPYIAASQA